jgi:hypothetical protein
MGIEEVAQSIGAQEYVLGVKTITRSDRIVDRVAYRPICEHKNKTSVHNSSIV